MTKISFLIIAFLTVQSAFAQISSYDQLKPGQSGSQTTQPIQLPVLGTGAFTTSAEFFRNLQGQGTLIQPPPYDMQVDTNSYVLGPGDVLNIGVWGANPFSYNLSITPEGSLIIPTFGEIHVGGLTLARAKELARKRLGTQFKNSNITLTLIYPRTFYVVVAGKVKTPGRYTVTSFDRVDRAFMMANMPKNQYDTTTVLPKFSLRRIKLIHTDGTTENVDLLKFYITGSLKDDPYLQQGDAIIVPEEDFASGSISISGAVKMPGNFEYVPGDRLKDLLELSQGMTALAQPRETEVYSLVNGRYSSRLVDATDSAVLNMELPPNSRVVVPIVREHINDYYVWVEGEVARPGIYPITRDSTKLSQIINLAGGFTEHASLSDAQIFREKTLRFDTSLVFTRTSGVSEEELPYIIRELKIKNKYDEVSANFLKLFANHDSSFDRFLKSGDIIYVPANKGAVYMFGQVKNPGYVDYHPGWTYRDYVREAGGYTDGAETGNVKIIKGGSYQWYEATKSTIAPGDLVFVPRTTIKPQLYTWNLTKDIIGTIGAVASIAATVILIVRTAQGK
ncbi:MAG: SLBB domain-containing protein [Candidatus Kryptoniota bacterium]